MDELCISVQHLIKEIKNNYDSKIINSKEFRYRKKIFSDEEIVERRKQQMIKARAKYNAKPKTIKQIEHERGLNQKRCKKYYQNKLDKKAEQNFQEIIKKEVHFKLIKVRFKLSANDIFYI